MWLKYRAHVYSVLLHSDQSLFARVLLVSNMCKDSDISLPDPTASMGKVFFHLLKVGYLLWDCL